MGGRHRRRHMGHHRMGMTFHDELIEAGARATHAAWADDNSTLSWDHLFEAGRDRWRGYMAVALDAMLAYRTTDECPTCGGTGNDPVTDNADGTGTWRCKKCDGLRRVPRDTPRLAIVEPAGFATASQPTRPLFRLAPDPPDTTP